MVLLVVMIQLRDARVNTIDDLNYFFLSFYKISLCAVMQQEEFINLTDIRIGHVTGSNKYDKIIAKTTKAVSSNR